ncbi:hypothetical protein HIM_05908 [Hirsutella minnesotensis 3608]|uniref:Uncharacterized protein n=1 Tax=Hirsutella minnesotensis 3608 TaxID=1043627 RepID=A0A0F7ZJY4_9HYPO|nr:hypothetical protein HIM_05908 [Hirsutella minnesotensis 3608]
MPDETPSAFEYSAQQEAASIFYNGILDNPLQELPAGLNELRHLVRFEGNGIPIIPINWRWTESISALKAFEATMLNRLMNLKYGIDPIEVMINTDHASLFFMSPTLAQITGSSTAQSAQDINPDTLKPFQGEAERHYIPDLHRQMATGIYETKDERYYHIHGALNPDLTLSALGLPLSSKPDDGLESIVERFQTTVSRFRALELDKMMNEQHRQAGTIVWSAKEYFASEHGNANANVGLYEIVRQESQHPPAWWRDHQSLPSCPRRPLAGLKVVDLTRVIAGPTITRSLAEMGASIMRVTSPHLPDYILGHRDLNWGKWNCSLHLKDEPDKQRLRELILDADIVVDGYRPGAMQRLGFGREDVFDLVKGRDRGIVHLRENCYGWHGPWAYRSGWQGISDACCGVSLAYGQAMGLDEPITPPFPNSDHCTGVIGSVGILHALIQRAEKGGNYGVDISLNYYSQWLVRSCGVYGQQVWDHIWKQSGEPMFRHYHNTRHTIPALLQSLQKHESSGIFFNEDFFDEFRTDAVGLTIKRVKPVARFKNGAVELGYNVGTRGNGVDKPRWPEDLNDEVVE